jgi:hypothetical protein
LPLLRRLGGLRARAARARQPGATALFITGCGADQNPEPRGSVELSRKYGEELAAPFRRRWTQPGHEITGSIRVAMEEVPLALQPLTRADLETMLASDDPPKKVKSKFLLDQIDRGQALITSYPAPIQAIRLGEQLLMIVMSGEAVVDWAHTFKRRFSDVSGMIWCAAYCNDMPGYIPTRRIQKEAATKAGARTCGAGSPRRGRTTSRIASQMPWTDSSRPSGPDRCHRTYARAARIPWWGAAAIREARDIVLQDVTGCDRITNRSQREV